MSLWKLIISVILLAFAAAGQSEHPSPVNSVTAVIPRLEELIRSGMEKTQVPGLSVAIVLGDRVVYLKGFGFRKAGQPERVDENTIFQLASISKPLAATIIASLVGTGEVNWDDKIS